ncbi:MAG: glycosyltransferase family 4 protein [Planctomycetota bacterium]
MNILLVAHHCNPDWGSEPLIGFKWFRELQLRANVTLVTHVRNRESLERSGHVRGQVHYIDTERTSSMINRMNDAIWPATAVVNRLALEAISQDRFDKRAFEFARGLCARKQIDLIHRVSPISPRYPSRLASLPVPFIMGPLNGGMEMPPGFEEIALKERAYFHWIRSFTRILEWLRPTLTRSTRILVARKGMQGIPESVRDRWVSFCENGVDPGSFSSTPSNNNGCLKLLSLGRLLPYKGVDMLLAAVARLPNELNWSLEIVGDGTERLNLEQRVRELNLETHVQFHGAVPVSDAPKWFNACDIFCMPSVRESGGAVVLEAMAAGKPVIVANHGGPAETVNDEVGIRIPVTNRETLIHGFSRAISELAADPRRRLALGAAGRRLIEAEYTWGVKADRIVRLYQDVLHEEAARCALQSPRVYSDDRQRNDRRTAKV